jgi:DNA-binding GntR family transcriptional regulator
MEEIYNVFDYNQTFHREIYEVYPNSQILKSLGQVWNQINRQRHLMITSKKFLDKIVSEHKDIIQSLKEKNVEKIEKNMHQHFKSGRMAVFEDLDSQM